MHIFSCYATTCVIIRSVMDEFYTDLDATLSSVPQTEIYVLLRDMNAHVESREVVDHQWDTVRGPHGLGVINEIESN